MLQAISYARFSSGPQALGSSEDRQRDMFFRWLDLHPQFQESPLSAIDRGKSAYKSLHVGADTGLARILKAIEEKRISTGDALVIETFDRISREETSVALERISKILTAGISIFTLEDNQSYTRENVNGSAMYVLVSKIQASHEYSKRLSARVKQGWTRNERKIKNEGAGSAKAANRPIWMNADGTLHSEKSEMVKCAISLYKSGLGIRAIMKEITEKYPEHAPKAETSIRRWFVNESLAGYWRESEAYEGLITLAEHQELKELVRQRAKYGKAEEQYLLSGVLKCNLCGSSFNFRRQTPAATKAAPRGSDEYRKKPDIVYANCSRYLKQGTCENSFTVPYEVAELVFSQVAAEVLIEIAESKAVSNIERKQYAGVIEKIQVLNEGVNRLRNIYEALGNEEDLERLKAKNSELDALKLRKKELEEKLDDEMKVSEYNEETGGTVDQDRLHEETQKLINELRSNVVNLRNELKEYGFRIDAGPRDGANVLVDSYGKSQYKIIRRSQLRGGYEVAAIHMADNKEGVVERDYLAVRSINK